MTTQHASGSDGRAGYAPPTTTGWRKVAEWVLGIGGTVAVFMGAFILLAAEDQWVGIGGDLSWRVGDITPGWGIGILIGGIVALLILLGSVLQRRR